MPSRPRPDPLASEVLAIGRERSVTKRLGRPDGSMPGETGFSVLATARLPCGEKDNIDSEELVLESAHTWFIGY